MSYEKLRDDVNLAIAKTNASLGHLQKAQQHLEEGGTALKQVFGEEGDSQETRRMLGRHAALEETLGNIRDNLKPVPESLQSYIDRLGQAPPPPPPPPRPAVYTHTEVPAEDPNKIREQANLPDQIGRHKGGGKTSGGRTRKHTTDEGRNRP